MYSRAICDLGILIKEFNVRTCSLVYSRSACLAGTPYHFVSEYS